MSNLSKFREKQNLTQEELAEKSGISVRTIQRIEAGNPPSGYTLKLLAKTLGIEAEQLAGEFGLQSPESGIGNFQDLKLINLSSLPFIILPPLNIIVPWLIAHYRKQINPITRQILSIQLLWLILALIAFMLSVFIRKWLGLDKSIITITMAVCILANIFIILKNAFSISRSGALSFRLKFSIL